MHTAATATLTAFHIDQHGAGRRRCRGIASITAFGILPRFAGVAVHDAYLGYNGFTGATHALCNAAHAVRELAGIGEFDTAARDEGWTGVMIDLLGDAYRWVGAWRSDGHDKLPEFKAADLRRRWDETLEQALAVHPPRPGRQTAGRRELRWSWVAIRAVSSSITRAGTRGERTVRTRTPLDATTSCSPRDVGAVR